MNFIGAPYPIVNTVHGLLAPPGSLEQIKADLLSLLLTNPGERVMLPAFGTPLRNLMFEPNNAALQKKARAMINTAISQWEPRITVDQITVTNGIDVSQLAPNDPRVDLGNFLSIQIVFKDPQNIMMVDDLTIQLPISGPNG